MIRSRTVWFFTPSNPKITFGGLIGEPKREMHELLPAQYISKYFNVVPGTSAEEVLEMMKSKGLNFPVFAKPEIGEQGVLVKKIDNEEQLRFYHSKMTFEYFIEDSVTYPMEVSLFYYRYPWEQKGHITGFLHKIPLQITGDGKRTLLELIQSDTKAKKYLDRLKKKHADQLNVILKAGEVYKLSNMGNHNQGAHFVDLKDEIDDTLVTMLDEISLSINDFFYGRYDILCSGVEELKKRQKFAILEYNGCGAEPNHIYDTGYTLREAYAEILKHWKQLFIISRYNHRQGIAYWPFMKGWRFVRESKQYMKQLRVIDQLIPF